MRPTLPSMGLVHEMHDDIQPLVWSYIASIENSAGP